MFYKILIAFCMFYPLFIKAQIYGNANMSLEDRYEKCISEGWGRYTGNQQLYCQQWARATESDPSQTSENYETEDTQEIVDQTTYVPFNEAF